MLGIGVEGRNSGLHQCYIIIYFFCYFNLCFFCTLLIHIYISFSMFLMKFRNLFLHAYVCEMLLVSFLYYVYHSIDCSYYMCTVNHVLDAIQFITIVPGKLTDIYNFNASQPIRCIILLIYNIHVSSTKSINMILVLISFHFPAI